ncbi:MAG: ribosome silencing factor [Candidatus Omnitrophota bacterium]
MARAAKDRKAQKVVVLDLRKLITFCDFFVIMSGTSDRHLAGLAQTIEEELNKDRIKPLFSGSASQNPESGWVILDYASVVVHIFQKPQREFYSLENLWQDAKKVRILSPRPREGRGSLRKRNDEKTQSPRSSPVPDKRLSKKP